MLTKFETKSARVKGTGASCGAAELPATRGGCSLRGGGLCRGGGLGSFNARPQADSGLSPSPASFLIGAAELPATRGGSSLRGGGLCREGLGLFSVPPETDSGLCHSFLTGAAKLPATRCSLQRSLKAGLCWSRDRQWPFVSHSGFFFSCEAAELPATRSAPGCYHG